jgi:Outer membrane protein beta-barrel domain
VGASIIYNSYGLDANAGAPQNADMNIWEFTGHAKYLFMPGPFTPYAKGSFGVMSSKYSANDPTFGNITTSTNDFGMGAGLGAQLRLPTGNLGFFGEGMAYTVMSSPDHTNYYAIRGGINLYLNPKP